MSSNSKLKTHDTSAELVKPGNGGDLVAGSGEVNVGGRPQSTRKRSVPRSADTSLEDSVKQAEQQIDEQAASDAATIAGRLQHRYNVVVARELNQILGGDAADYFRLDVENLGTLPEFEKPVNGYLAAIDIKSLPSAD